VAPVDNRKKRGHSLEVEAHDTAFLEWCPTSSVGGYTFDPCWPEKVGVAAARPSLLNICASCQRPTGVTTAVWLMGSGPGHGCIGPLQPVRSHNISNLVFDV